VTHAYKFLAAGARGRFTGFEWEPGAWVETSGPLEPCANGIHACGVEELPTWIGDELWAVELDGELVEDAGVLVARRARLVEQVAGWDRVTMREFASACSQHAQPYGGIYAEDAATFAVQTEDAAMAAVTAFVAAKAAEAVDGDPGFAAERSWQAGWLGERLDLDF
jgi:hypothetical protein